MTTLNDKLYPEADEAINVRYKNMGDGTHAKVVVSLDPTFWGSHVYTYDGSGHRLTDTWTYGTAVRVKTYTWTGSNLMTESDWVLQ